MYIHIFPGSVSLEVPISTGTSVAPSTPSIQIIVSNTPHQQKEPRLLGEIADIRTLAGNIQDESGVFLVPEIIQKPNQNKQQQIP